MHLECDFGPQGGFFSKKDCSPKILVPKSVGPGRTFRPSGLASVARYLLPSTSIIGARRRLGEILKRVGNRIRAFYKQDIYVVYI